MLRMGRDQVIRVVENLQSVANVNRFVCSPNDEIIRSMRLGGSMVHRCNVSHSRVQRCLNSAQERTRLQTKIHQDFARKHAKK